MATRHTKNYYENNKAKIEFSRSDMENTEYIVVELSEANKSAKDLMIDATETLDNIRKKTQVIR